MLRTKTTLLAVTVALTAIVSGGVAAAGADTGSTGSTGATGTSGATGSTGATTVAAAVPATIIVNGAGYATVDSTASTATEQSQYDTALASALVDAHTKALSLTSDAGDVLGAVENITEESNDDGCASPVMLYSSGAAPRAPAKAPTAGKSTGNGTSSAGNSTAGKSHKHHKTRKATARIADDSAPTTCSIEADVTVTYAMSAS